jgi:hypothetical protein
VFLNPKGKVIIAGEGSTVPDGEKSEVEEYVKVVEMGEASGKS